MKKEIRHEEVCETCGSVKCGTLYEVYCDECGVLVEKGETYGRGLEYTVWDDSIEDFDDKHFRRDFCSYKCLLAHMKIEPLGKGKRISLQLSLEGEDRDKLIAAITK